MIIESVKLNNFRNYEEMEIPFDPGTNIFHGKNAQGKTNILEAVFLCGTTRSHRQAKDREMIRFGEEESHLRMSLVKRDITYRIDMHLKKSKAKGIAINGVPIHRASELVGLGYFVFFSPEDLNIIKNGPAERRRFLDMHLCQMNMHYIQNLVSYQKALMQRNRLLKDLFFHPEYRDTLDVWDAQLVRYGTQVIKEREKFVLQFAGKVKEVHRSLTGGKDELILSYEKNTGPFQFAGALIENRSKDERMKITSCGPHRDDLSFLINGVDIRRYGSQGQQRTAALSLKLAEIGMIREKTGDTPVLLLDDVLSELDSDRQRYLLSSIQDIQTLITCTGVEDFVENRFPIDSLFFVNDGNVLKES